MLLFVVIVASQICVARAAEPRLLIDKPGFGLEQIAHEPDIVTPIGMAFDKKGRLLVIESHTHQRPADYQGPKGDRIRMFADTDRDGRLDTWTTFAEGYQQAMNLCVRPDGAVYLVTRRDVRILDDTNDDGVSDKETIILHLETTGEYPHNGMSGIAIAPPVPADKEAPFGGSERDAGEEGKADLMIGIGENSGIPYTLVGSDGTKFDMRDGAGNVYVCGLDGSAPRLAATGFWNPFGLCTVRGHLFCIDNDPDASPPCRLVDVQPGGDYGFRYQYGRAGVHPLEAWNGELPGTLAPICGVGEAPTAIVVHQGRLWVTSWGDHRIEAYQLESNGDGRLSARRTVVVQGDAEFRPTGMAIAPNGDLVFGDWVSRNYPVHGHGRLWRLKTPPTFAAEFPTDIAHGGSAFAERFYSPDSGSRRGPPSWEELDADGRIQRLQWERSRWAGGPSLWDISADDKKEDQAGGDDGGARSGPNRAKEAMKLLNMALQDRDPNVRLYAVRWIADEKLTGFRDEVAKLLDGDVPSERYFLAALAAIDWLDGKPPARNGAISDELLQRELANDERSPHLHALALRLIAPDDKWLTIDRLRDYLASGSPELQLEAVRTLTRQSNPARFDVLADLAGDVKLDAQIRAEAVIGLAPVADEHRELFDRLAANGGVEAREVARVRRLRRGRAAGAGEDPEQYKRPESTDLDAWNALLAEGGDAESGRRLFFAPVGIQCANCHQHGGRGGQVGPDLTRIGKQQNRERIIASIIQPSREIAPEFQAWTLQTVDGLTHMGLRLPKGGDDGVEPYADPQGKTFKLKSEEIEFRAPLQTSIMPEGMVDGLTVEDLRDLVAFLTAAK